NRRNKNPRIFIRGKAHCLCAQKVESRYNRVNLPFTERRFQSASRAPLHFWLDTQHLAPDTSHMALPPDLHMHTPLCRHATGEPVDYAKRAVELGFKEIGFSDHSPMRRDDFDDWRMRFDQLGEYVEKV